MTQDCTGRLVTRTAGTEAAYVRRVSGLRKAAKCDTCGTSLVPLVTWFCAQDGRWADSTVRQYRAAIFYALEQETPCSPDYNQLVDRLNIGPAPKVGGPQRTSAKKRKSLKREEFLQLMKYLAQRISADDYLIQAMVAYGPALFLRPSEYLGAYVVGNMLFVPNAKATNGRANGDVRERSLDNMSLKAKASLIKFLKNFQERATAADSWKSFHDRLSSRLARVCKLLKIRRVSFYTLRHVGLATAKTWMSAREVAAAAGHASMRTSTSHYAKRRTGWFGLKLAGLPSRESMAQVRGQVRVSCPARDRIHP